MKRIISVLAGSVLVLAASVSVAVAQDFSSDKPIPILPPPGVTSSLREGFREEVKTLRESTKNQIESLRETAKKQIETYKESIERTREQFKQDFEAKKTELKSRIEAEKSELKDRLLKIRDERKKQVVERISGQINDLNQRMLNHFSDVLDKLAEVLTRISDRGNKAASRGLDVTTVSSTIATAHNAIAIARTAIETQATKVYAVMSATTTEATIKNDVGEVRQIFGEDLRKVRDAVFAARDAVRNAAVALAQIHGVDEDKGGATSTATSTSGQ